MLGTLNNEFGDYPQAETWLRQAVEIEEHLLAAAPGNMDHKVNLAIDKSALATVCRNQGKLDDYKTQITAATEVMRPLLERDDSRLVLDTWARLMSIQHDYRAALTTLEKVVQKTGTEETHAEIVEVALRSGEAKKAIEYAKRIEPRITLGTQRTETLAAYAAALAVEGDVVNARLIAQQAADSAALHGGTALDRGGGAEFMPEVTHARAVAVRALLDDLAAMKGKRDKEGWTRATNAFVRALSETP